MTGHSADEEQAETEQDVIARKSARLFLLVEHAIYVALGVLLALAALLALVGAGVLLVQGLGDWAGTGTIFNLIDRLLFVLMLVEILHTVRVSVRSGQLTGEPFLIVALIASIRRVLVITLKTSDVMNSSEDWTPGQEALFRSSMIELGVLAGLILVMVVSIFILQRSRAGGSTGMMKGG